MYLTNSNDTETREPETTEELLRAILLELRKAAERDAKGAMTYYTQGLRRWQTIASAMEKLRAESQRNPDIAIRINAEQQLRIAQEESDNLTEHLQRLENSWPEYIDLMNRRVAEGLNPLTGEKLG